MCSVLRKAPSMSDEAREWRLVSVCECVRLFTSLHSSSKRLEGSYIVMEIMGPCRTTEFCQGFIVGKLSDVLKCFVSILRVNSKYTFT